MSTNIITDFQINNNLTITDNNLKIQTDGTTDTLDISGNVDVSSNLIIRGYIGIKTETPVVSIDISANDALRLPVGNNSSRPDYTAIDCSGCIRYNSETTQFEGFSPSGLSWIGLGGVVDIDQDTKILAELNSDEDKLRFYTAGGQQMLIDEYGNVGIGLASANDPAYILDINSTGAIRIPIGTTSQRDDITNTAGLIRYNSTNNEFEGYSTAWGGLGGVKTPTGNTKITADDTNGLEFFTNNTERMNISKDGHTTINISSGYQFDVKRTSSSGSNGMRLLNSNGNYRNIIFINGSDAGYFQAYDSSNTTKLLLQAEGNSYFIGGNVGIGTNEPSYMLHLKSTADTVIRLEADTNNSGEDDNPLIWLSQDGGGTTSHFMKIGIVGSAGGHFTNSLGNSAFISADQDLQFATCTGDGGTPAMRMTIADEGYVGIGTSSPHKNLVIFDEDATLRIDSTWSGNKTTRFQMVQSGTANISAASPTSGFEIQLDSNITPARTYFGHYNGSTTFNKHMTIYRTNGNVGIGQSSPAEKLDVVGNIKTTGYISRATTNSGFLRGYQSGLDTHTKPIFCMSGQIPNSTDLASMYGIGWANGSSASFIKGSGSGYGMYTANAGTVKWWLGATNSYFNGGNFGIGTTSAAAKLHVVGDTVVTGDITAYYSDERLKTFKGKITEPLAKIKQLNGYYFVENELAKSLGYDNDKLQVGVSAQEVEKVLPEIVTKAPIDHKYKTVWYQKLTPLLIEGMKEQQTQIEQQHTQIEQQQTQIQSLQEQIDELKELIKNI